MLSSCTWLCSVVVGDATLSLSFCCRESDLGGLALDGALDTGVFEEVTEVRRPFAEVGPVALPGPVALLVGRGLEVDAFGWLRSNVNEGPRGVVNGRLGGMEDFVIGFLESERREFLSWTALDWSSGVLAFDAVVEDRVEARSGGGILVDVSFLRGLISIEYIRGVWDIGSRDES